MTENIKINTVLERSLSGEENLLLLQKTQVQFPTPPWWPTTIYNSSSKGSNTLHGHQVCKWCAHIKAGKTLTDMKITLKKSIPFLPKF